MTTFDDPNRQSIGLDPIWTGAGEPAEPPEGGDGEEGGDEPETEPEESEREARPAPKPTDTKPRATPK